MLVYHFVSDAYALENIRKRHIKIAEISKLNDPFEMLNVYFSDAEERKIFQQLKREIGERFGIICHSRNWSNPVHWSHYGGRHAGVAYGFDVPKEALSRVSYETKRPKTNLKLLKAQGRLNERWLQKVLSSKFKHWEYEQEMRQWIDIRNKLPDEKGILFENFGDHLNLRQVVVGHASRITRSQLDDALGTLRNDVVTIKARLAFQKFEVCTQLNEKLWL